MSGSVVIAALALERNVTRQLSARFSAWNAASLLMRQLDFNPRPIFACLPWQGQRAPRNGIRTRQEPCFRATHRARPSVYGIRVPVDDPPRLIPQEAALLEVHPGVLDLDVATTMLTMSPWCSI